MQKWQQKKKKPPQHPGRTRCWLWTSETARWDRQNWFQIISLLAQPPPSPLSVICLQLRDADLAVLISLAGIIAVMIGFAGNTDRRVETSALSDWELLENRAKARRVCLARLAQSFYLIKSISSALLLPKCQRSSVAILLSCHKGLLRTVICCRVKKKKSTV